MLARFAWSVVAYNIAVILWGAYVRASGSGAGCGQHWPLCNGEVIPRAPSLQMLIELSHRVTSGFALVAVVALLVWTRRAHGPGHPARRAAGWVVGLMLVEAAVGAGLVLFELVADNASMARAMFMAAHLTNTLLLLAALTLTAHWLSGGAPIRLAGRRGPVAQLGLLLGGVLVVSMSGAVAALGDTLFPAGSLSQALTQDLSASSHVLLRLRLLHPVLATVAGALVLMLAPRIPAAADLGAARRFGGIAAGLAALQLALGLTNVLLLAPVWMQLLHLLVADLLWMSLVLLAATTLAAEAAVSHGGVSRSPVTSREMPTRATPA